MPEAFDIRSHVPLLAGNLYALPSRGSMAFKFPSFGLLERTKRSSPLIVVFCFGGKKLKPKRS